MTNPTLVLFGMTGDLAQHKLVPALWSGFRHGRFTDLEIWGVGRKPWGTHGLHEKARLVCQPLASQEVQFSAFLKRLHFFRVDVDSKKEFDEFCKKMENQGDLLFMLATAPELFPKISNRLGKLKNAGFRRVMIEKPFGSDLASAKKLHHLLQKHFGDDVYPIDHYLGKSTVRNIMVLRFSNPVFEPTWNQRFIKDVQIIQSEEGGVGHRTNFYNQTGALRDMVQSHLLQMLARVAMEPPKVWEPISVSKEKARVLQKLRPAPGVIFGQYDGYEKEVGRSSQTETFVALKAFIDTPRWKGVPFYLMTGKKLDKRFAQVVITYKPVHYTGIMAGENQLVITLQPDESFALTVNLKEPGESALKSFTMDYCQSCEVRPFAPQAYEILFQESLLGKKTFFASWPEIEAGWTFVESVRNMANSKKLEHYQEGSQGPIEAQKITDWKEYLGPISEVN